MPLSGRMGAKGSFSPDLIKADTNGIVWFHRNADFPADVVKKAKGQGIVAEAVHDATTKRIFGGALDPNDRDAARRAIAC